MLEYNYKIYNYIFGRVSVCIWNLQFVKEVYKQQIQPCFYHLARYMYITLTRIAIPTVDLNNVNSIAY